MTFCMLQKALGKNILLSSKRCSPASRRLGSRSTPANIALAPTNLTIWVITSLVTELCPHQKCFDAIKRVIGREVFFAYPDFNAPFEIHTDASKLQLGAVISQKGKPIAFYFVNRKQWACPFGIWLRQFVVWNYQYVFQTEHCIPVRPTILHVLSHVW